MLRTKVKNKVEYEQQSLTAVTFCVVDVHSCNACAPPSRARAVDVQAMVA